MFERSSGIARIQEHPPDLYHESRFARLIGGNRDELALCALKKIMSQQESNELEPRIATIPHRVSGPNAINRAVVVTFRIREVGAPDGQARELQVDGSVAGLLFP